jgi:hypothetical protein
MRMALRVVVIVEGHGEDASIRTLLEKIWYEFLGGDFVEVIPWRHPQGRLLQEETLEPVIEAAALKLNAPGAPALHRLLLILIDSEGECPAKWAPKVLKWARKARSDTQISCVMPNPMFETWFAAAATSLDCKNDLPDDLAKPDDPEAMRLGKNWIRQHLPRKYKETIDQPRFVAHTSVEECLGSPPSFRKLCKEIGKYLPPGS